MMTERSPYSPFPLIHLALDNARLLIGVPLAVAALAVVLGLVQGGQYTAWSSFKPQHDQPELGRLGGIAAQFGLDMGGAMGGGESVDFYARLARSRTLLESVAAREYTTSSGRTAADLAEVYGIDVDGVERSRRTVRRLDRDLSVDTDINAGVVGIATRHRDRAIAEQLNRAILDEINRFNLERRQSQASSERQFVEAQVARARQDLAAAENALSEFMQSNRRYEEWPQLRVEAGRLQRQVDLQQQVFTSLTQSLEQARLDEVRNTPVITVIDQPERSAQRRRGLAARAVLGTILGLTIVLVYIFGREYTRRLQREYPEEYARVRKRRPWLAAVLVLGLPACDGRTFEPVEAPVIMTALSSGTAHSCGLADDGTVWCWGRGAEGQLGVGSGGVASTAVPVQAGLAHASRAVSAGETFTCALDQEGAAWCWGTAPWLADGTATRVVPDTAFVAISAGGAHACGLAADGSAWCWGANDSGQLGDGTTVPADTPVAVLGGRTFSRITTGSAHTCAMDTGDSGTNIWCWGLNDVGQVGNNTHDPTVPVPGPIATNTRMRDVSAGFDHTCAIAMDFSLVCWGGNGHGQIANGAAGVPGAIRPFASPTPHRFLTIEAGHEITCGVAMDTRGICWGSGTSGQVGVGNPVDHYWPQYIHFLPTHNHTTDLLRFHSVNPGRDHVCGLALDGVAFCWGSGAQGQLGNPRLGESLLPVRVRLMR